MAPSPAGNGASVSDWLKPPVEREGLRRYVETVRERIWIVIAAIVLTLAIAVAYVATAEKTYEAEADLIIQPVPSENSPLIALPLIFESVDPIRDVETAARLIATNSVAEQVIAQLGLDVAPESLLEKIEAEPVAQSNVVSITAQADSPDGARDLANSFAEAAVAERTQRLHDAIDELLPALEERAAQESAEGLIGSTSAEAVLAQLEALRNADDPSIRVEALAQSPTSPVAPRPVLSIAAGLFAGLVLGASAAFALQVLDPRLRREEQLRRSYGLPILGRIPREPKRQNTPISPLSLTTPTTEAYRTLRATLVALSRSPSDGGRAILVTGSSPSEGKTTTAINLATSLAVTGRKVILIEADLRRPAIGRTLDLPQPANGVVSVLVGNLDLTDALVTTKLFGSYLGLLLADNAGGWIAELFSLPAARELIEDAKRAADFVIVDSPPLTEVIDALPLATYVDDVLIVARLGRTKLDKLNQLGELLAENQIRPAGFAVVGTPRPRRTEYHYYAEADRRLIAPGGANGPRRQAPTQT